MIDRAKKKKGRKKAMGTGRTESLSSHFVLIRRDGLKKKHTKILPNGQPRSESDAPIIDSKCQQRTTQRDRGKFTECEKASPKTDNHSMERVIGKQKRDKKNRE